MSRPVCHSYRARREFLCSRPRISIPAPGTAARGETWLSSASISPRTRETRCFSSRSISRHWTDARPDCCRRGEESCPKCWIFDCAAYAEIIRRYARLQPPPPPPRRAICLAQSYLLVRVSSIVKTKRKEFHRKRKRKKGREGERNRNRASDSRNDGKSFWNVYNFTIESKKKRTNTIRMVDRNEFTGDKMVGGRSIALIVLRDRRSTWFLLFFSVLFFLAEITTRILRRLEVNEGKKSSARQALLLL